MADGIAAALGKLSINEVEIAYVTNYSMSGLSRETPDKTHLQSTFKVSTVSIPEPGEISFDVNLDPANETHTGLYTLMTDKEEKDIVCTFSNDVTMSFVGYVTGIDFDNSGIDDILSGSITCKLNSLPTFGSAA